MNDENPMCHTGMTCMKAALVLGRTPSVSAT